MKNEKMMILNMLEEGRITADEASRLLSGVEERPGPSAGGGSPAPPPPRRPAEEAAPASNDGRRPPPSKHGLDFDELGRKFASFAKDLEPKIQRATEVVAETTMNIADRISKTIESGLDTKPRVPTSSSTSGTEKNVELYVEDGYNELNLAGLNAQVRIKGYNGDKITARIGYRARRGARSAIELMKLGGKYYLSYEEDEFEFVSIDAYVPSHKFKVVSISGINGNMDLSAIECGQLQVSCGNGQTTLSDLSADSIKSESGNGRLTVSGITAGTAIIEHFNGIAEAWEVDLEKLSLSNGNGSLSLSVSAFNRYNDYLWNVETSNAKLTLNVPTLPDLGYHIRARAALGTVRIGLTGMEFLINDPGHVEARNAAFDRQAKKVRLALETSNGVLAVN